MRVLLWIILGLAAVWGIGILAETWLPSSATDRDQALYLTWGVGALVIVVSALLSHRERLQQLGLSTILLWILAWIALFAALILGYTYWTN